MSTTLQDLVNRAVFFSTEAQTHFGALIADAEWEVDFTSDPHLTFTSPEGTVLDGRPHLLGSESSGQSTWLWGWDNINEFPEAVVGLAHDVRKFGAAEDVAELITEELALDEELALRLTLAAKEVTGKWAHYPAAAGAGTTVWLLVDAPELTLPAPRVKTTVRALMQGLTQTTVTDHRAALEAYAAKRDVPTAELNEGGLRLLFADGSADLSFDDQRRISNCEVGAPLEGEAVEQYAQATGTSTAAATETVGTPASEPAAKPAAPTASSASEPAASGRPASDRTVDTETAPAASTSTDSTTSMESTEITAPAPESSAATTSPAEATAGVESTSAGSETEAATEQTPSEPAASTADQSFDPDAETDAAETKAEEPKKKKGLFSKLFGR